MPTPNDNSRDWSLDSSEHVDNDLDHADYFNDFREFRFDDGHREAAESSDASEAEFVHSAAAHLHVAASRPGSVPPPVERAVERVLASAATGETTIAATEIAEFSESVELKTETESEQLAPDAEQTNTVKSHRSRQPDPIVQSLVLLATMAVMLATARYAVPQVVEEIRYAWHRGELRAEYDTGNEGLKNVSLDSLSQAYQMVTAAVGPSVVHIEVSRASNLDQTLLANLVHSDALMVADQGSGVVIDREGYLLTNRHVIAGGRVINVTLSDGRRTTASVVGTDPLTDLAVLKVNIDKLLPIQWGNSDRCRVGSPVWAVGSPFGLDRTVTFGILSGKHRMVRASTQYQDFMQSDVAVNPGNSGGPLVDARGRLVGINTAIVGETYQGVSFSIPSNVVRGVYERIKETGRVERGWLGVGLGEVSDDELVGENARVRGAIVSAMTDRTSPAALAGLEVGDLILCVDKKPISDVGHLMRMIGGCVVDTVVNLEVYRSGERIVLPVRLGRRPEF